MFRSLFTGAALAVAVLASPVEAVPPDRLESYTLVPRLSELRETGGFAGVDDRYLLTGGYDFLTEWSGGTPTEPLRLTARFDNAEVWGSLISDEPTIAIVRDVDRLLNLEGLRGELLPLPLAFTPLEVFRFDGIINDGVPASPLESSTIELFAVRFGPWTYLRGETTPPPWTSDYFEYELRSLARTGEWSDWTGDGVVDAADYSWIRDTASMLAEPSGRFLTEAVALWRTQYGEEAPDASVFEAAIELASLPQSQAQTIPEPTAVLLIAVAVTLAPRTRRFACRP